ncbi:MAG: hypothetical protein ABSG78_13535 [Verrucomicrobiota bacterium]
MAKTLLASAGMLAATVCSTASLPAADLRQTLNCSRDWKFRPGDVGGADGAVIKREMQLCAAGDAKGVHNLYLQFSGGIEPLLNFDCRKCE